MNRHPKILQREKAALLAIDIQERILPAIFEHERVVENTIKLINGFKILKVPIYFTEQYPKGLGPTEPRIKAALENSEAIQKMTFSCFGAGGLFDQLKKKELSKLLFAVSKPTCVFYKQWWIY